MKYCKNCGAENNDENQFCFNCRCDSFSDSAPVKNTEPQPVTSQPAPQPMPRPVPPPPPPMPIPQPRMKKPLGVYDLLAILGFVAALVGMFSTSIILHPVSAIASIIGFVGNTRFKGLALAGFVIAIVGGIVFTVISLYENGYIPEWITDGAFH